MVQSSQMILISCLAALVAMSKAATVPPAVSARSSGLPTTGIDSSCDSTMAATTMDTTTADTATTTQKITTAAGIHITLSSNNDNNTTTEVPSTTSTTTSSTTPSTTEEATTTQRPTTAAGIHTTLSSSNNDDNTTTEVPTTEVPSTTTTTTTTSTTTTSTTTEKTPRMCYNCNSGSRLRGMWYNHHCTENGTIGDNHKPMACSKDYCSTSVGRFPVGSVYRGCGDAIYIPKHEKVIPGCSMRGNRYVCLCTSDGCNNQDLSEKAAEYLNQCKEAAKAKTNAV